MSKEVSDQDLKFSGYSLLPDCLASGHGGRGRGGGQSRRDLIATEHRVPTFLSGVETYLHCLLQSK